MEREIYRIRLVQMDNPRCLLLNWRMDRKLIVWIRDLCKVMKGIDEKVLQWFSHIKEWKNDRIKERVYLGESM